MPITTTHLAGEDQPPESVRRDGAADQRAGGDGDGTGGRHQPVGARSVRTREVGRRPGATIAGMISAAPTPSRNDQPKISTVRLGAIAVVNEPHAVDDAADRERACGGR